MKDFIKNHSDILYVTECSTSRKIRHYNDVIMGAIASQITSLTIVYSTVYSDADQRRHQSSASLAFVKGIHRGPVNSPQKWPVTRKLFPFDDVIMTRFKFALFCCSYILSSYWIRVIDSPIFFKVSSPASGQLYDCAGVKEDIRKNTGNIILYQTTTTTNMICIIL